MDTVPKTMKAAVIDEFGGLDKFNVRDVPVPQCADDEVLVRVRAAGVGIWDAMQRTGKMMPEDAKFPVILGAECAGEIAALGPDVKDLQVGEPVYAYVEGDQGAYAQYVNVKASAIARKPEKLSFVEAAAVPVDAITADQAVSDALQVDGDTILYVAGGSGGVGTWAIQLGRVCGAGVIASAGPDNLDYVRELGAESAIDYTKADPAKIVRQRFSEGVDAAVDCVGGENAKDTIEAVRDGGRFAELTETDVGEPRGIRVTHIGSRPDGKRLTKLTKLIDDGKVRVIVDTVYPLEKVREAQQKVESRHVRGKVVLEIP